MLQEVILSLAEHDNPAGVKQTTVPAPLDQPLPAIASHEAYALHPPTDLKSTIYSKDRWVFYLKQSYNTLYMSRTLFPIHFSHTSFDP